MVPEELFFTEVLERLRKSMEQRGRNRRAHDGFLRAVNDPFANAVHIALLRGKSPRSLKARARNSDLRRKAMAQGPGSLSQSDKAQLLRDAESMAALHFKVRQIRDSSLAQQWGVIAFH